MGAACGGRGFKGRAAVSGEGPIGAAGCRQQHNRASCHPPPPPGKGPAAQFYCGRGGSCINPRDPPPPPVPQPSHKLLHNSTRSNPPQRSTAL